MKTDTHEEISFTNCYSGLYLSKQEGAIAVEFKSSEIVLYLNTSLYQSLAWLLQNASDKRELMDFITWTTNPSIAPRNAMIEIHGPEHCVCLVCSPKHERVQLNFETGVSVDLRFSDFKGLLELIIEAQNDLEWRRQLLHWTLKKENQINYKDINRDRKSL